MVPQVPSLMILIKKSVILDEWERDMMVPQVPPS
jgi:hypothetical protein